METQTTTCERCGAALHLADYPFCPHGNSHTVFVRDERPGGVVYENYGPQPVRFDSESERRAYMKANGLVQREGFKPMPGTDIDPAGIPNPKGYMDPYTMEAGRALLSRSKPRDEEAVEIHITTEEDNLTEAEALALAAQMEGEYGGIAGGADGGAVGDGAGRDSDDAEGDTDPCRP